MIIREAPVDNAWYRAAATWFIALCAINCLVWPVLDFYAYDLSRLWWMALAIPLGSVILWMFGRFLGEPKRVLLFVMVIGLFGIIPLLAGLILPIFVLFFLPGAAAGSLIFVALCLTFSVCWIYIKIKVLKEKILSERFIEREFRTGSHSIYLNRAPTTDLDTARAKDVSRVGNTAMILPALVFLLAVAYPLQRLFLNSGGIPGVVFLLAILGTPLAIHVLGRTACGFYLWIYTVRRLELQHGKPVIFEPSETDI